MLSEFFCVRLLNSKSQFVDTFLIDVNIIFLRIFWPIYRLRFRNKPCQLPLMGVIFSATKFFYNFSGLGGLAILKCLTHFHDTCPRLFTDGHNARFYCIKDKGHDRRHLYFSSFFGSKSFFILTQDTKRSMFMPTIFLFLFFHLLTYINSNILMDAK